MWGPNVCGVVKGETSFFQWVKGGDQNFYKGQGGGTKYFSQDMIRVIKAFAHLAQFLIFLFFCIGEVVLFQGSGGWGYQNCFSGSKGGDQTFSHRQRGTRNIYAFKGGDQKKIANWPSRIDAPLLVKNDSSLNTTVVRKGQYTLRMKSWHYVGFVHTLRILCFVHRIEVVGCNHF